jgi:hypothetical protein
LTNLHPFAANTDPSDHPALESLAAYLDGRLPEPERPEMAAHLDSCAACYEIYTESLRFQNEERSQDTRGVVLPFERKKGWIPPRLLRPLALPLAALLLVGVGTAVWFQLHRPLEARSVDILTASLRAPGILTEKLGPFDVNRGPGEELANFTVVAFQSGATLVDLRVAIEAGDAERIDQFAHSLGVLFHHVSDFSPQPDIAAVEAAVGRFREGGPSAKVRLTDFLSLERILRSTNEDDLLAPHFELGKWTEAGRLATYGGRTGFFADSENRKSLRRFRRHPPKPEKAEVKAALDQIDDAWPEGPLTRANQTPLAVGFGQVIDSYDVPLTVD